MQSSNPIIIIEENQEQINFLRTAISEVMPEQEIKVFSRPDDVLDCLKTQETGLIILDEYCDIKYGLDFLGNMEREEGAMLKKSSYPFVIICTGIEDKEYRLQAFEKGIMDYVIKPYSKEELQFRIERVLEFKKMEKQICRLKTEALKDALTGLWNRRALDKELERIFELSKRYQMDFSVLMIDLDKFKKYNDRYGHVQGDVALKSIGEVILRNIRKSDFAARFGGEEFMIILPYTDENGARILGERLVSDLKQKQLEHLDNPPHNVVTATVGLAFKKENENVLNVVRKADEALYYGKKSSKEVVSFTDLLKKEN